MFGDEIKDAEGVGTGKRSFKFDKSLLPTYSGDLQGRTKVTLPEFADKFEGTPAEMEAQLQNVRDSRGFLYSAGLTNLQGEIDKETQKLKNEGAKEVQKIAAQGDIYKTLVGAFSF
jgi:elongation factor P hydroxylase